MIKTIGIAISIICIVIGLWFVWGRATKAKTPDRALDGKTVSIEEDGFYPDQLTVSAGTTISFVNDDKYWHWPASDPHPSHTFYSELDPREPIKPGGTWQVTLIKPGTWGIHDHLAPYVIGQIVVTPSE